METFGKLRRRLTLTYTLVLAGLSVLTAVILLVAITLNLERENNDTLKISTTQLANAYELSESDLQSPELENLLNGLSDNATDYRVWDSKAQLVLKSDESVLDDETASFLVKKFYATNNDTAEITDFDRGTESFKVCTNGFVSGGKLTTVMLTKNMSSQRYLLEEPLLIVIAVIITGLIISVFLGNLLARKALEPVKKSYEQQRNFLADASHELRTPVAVVLANLEAAGTDNGPWISNAYDETKKIKRVVEDLLFLAKADAGETVSDFEPVDLSYLVLGVTEKLEPLARQKNLDFFVNIDAAEQYVFADAKRIEEALTVFIDNAIKYTDSGSVSVKLLSDTDSVRVIIDDTGVGIAKEDYERIYERFYRAGQTRDKSGTGLGLAIARYILNEHKAGIKLKSEPGEGSSFTLTFKRIYKK